MNMRRLRNTQIASRLSFSLDIIWCDRRRRRRHQFHLFYITIFPSFLTTFSLFFRFCLCFDLAWLSSARSSLQSTFDFQRSNEDSWSCAAIAFERDFVFSGDLKRINNSTVKCARILFYREKCDCPCFVSLWTKDLWPRRMRSFSRITFRKIAI